MNEIRHSKTLACYQFELELQLYLEGEDRPFVPVHAGACAFCNAIVEDLQTLRSAASAIPLEEPCPAVWSNIRARLAEEGALRERRSHWQWLWQLGFLHRPVPAAAFACLVVLGCLVTVPRNYLERDFNSGLMGLPAQTAMQSMGFADESGALEQVVRELEKTFRAREGSLAPELKATYESSLNSLDASIRECGDSLQREPGNSLAHEYLLAAYSQKAEVLSSALEFDEGR